MLYRPDRDPFPNHFVTLLPSLLTRHDWPHTTKVVPLVHAMTHRFTTDAMFQNVVVVDPSFEFRPVITPCPGCARHKRGETDLSVEVAAFTMTAEIDLHKHLKGDSTFIGPMVEALRKAKNPHRPNLMGITKSFGARLTICAKPGQEIRSLAEYAARWRGWRGELEAALNPLIEEFGHIDNKTKDPNRAWRCTKVLLEDGRNTFDRETIVLSEDLCDFSSIPRIEPHPLETVNRQLATLRAKMARDNAVARGVDAVAKAREKISGLHAIEGQGGDTTLFVAAGHLAYWLPDDEETALELLTEWNVTNASPPFETRRLEYKIRQAYLTKGGRDGQ